MENIERKNNWQTTVTNKTQNTTDDILNILSKFSDSQLLSWNSELLSKQEEIILTDLVQKGEKAKQKLQKTKNNIFFLEEEIKIGKLATNILLISNNRLVYSIAEQITRQKYPSEDILQEWNMGVIKASKTFSHLKWSRFPTYARWRIRQYILLYIKKSKGLYIPMHTVKKCIQIKKLIKNNNLNIENLSEEDIDKLTKLSGLPKDNIYNIISTIKNERFLSLDYKSSNEGNSLQYVIADNSDNPEENYYKKQLKKTVRNNIKQLFLENEKSAYIKKWIIISFRNNIYWLNQDIVKALIKLTNSNNLNIIHDIPKNFIDIYLEKKETILDTLKWLIINPNINNEQKWLIIKLCNKITDLGDNIDLITKEFQKKNDTTTILFCLIGDYKQKNINTKNASIKQTIIDTFLQDKNNIISFFDFIKELLFLYSCDINNKKTTEKELEKLYKKFIKNMKPYPTLKELWLLFNVSRERIRQIEKQWLIEMEDYFRKNITL